MLGGVANGRLIRVLENQPEMQDLTAYDLMVRARIAHQSGDIAEACRLLGQAADILLFDGVPDAPLVPD